LRAYLQHTILLLAVLRYEKEKRIQRCCGDSSSGSEGIERRRDYAKVQVGFHGFGELFVCFGRIEVAYGGK